MTVPLRKQGFPRNRRNVEGSNAFSDKNGGPMEKEFALSLTDIRLLQTWHLLRLVIEDDPDSADQESLSAALEAVSLACDIVKKLKASPGGGQPTVTSSAA